MARLIDADAMLEYLNLMYDEQHSWRDDYNVGVLGAINYIKHKAPTIDAVSVVHGEWKPFDLKWGRSIWYCTACEEGVEVPCDIWTHKPIYNYCPYCGARMDGERKESE